MIDFRVKKVIEFPDQSSSCIVSKTPANLAFDASWSHTRSAKLYVTDFINIGHEKIVTFSVLDKFINDEFMNYKRTSINLEA